MPRSPRKLSEANLYHVFARGVGRQTIFEDTDDCVRFKDLLRAYARETAGSLLAWCLMDNHFHLLANMEMPELSKFMRRLEVTYARYYNSRYDRPGCLFQGRFGSEPILDDAQLVAAVRYIHLNPQKAGIARFDNYEWSSYREYVTKPDLCEIGLVLDIVGSRNSFRKLHEIDGFCEAFMEDSTNDGHARARHVSDKEVREMIERSFGEGWRAALLEASRTQRDELLCSLKAHGASVRQISRITGIGRCIVQKAKM